MPARTLKMVAVALIVSACGSDDDRGLNPTATYEAHGVPFEPAGSLPARAIFADADTFEGRSAMVEGVLLEGCDSESCWMTMDAGGENVIRVLAPENEFPDPETVAGRRAVVHGQLSAADSTLIMNLRATGIMVEKVRS
ncbi:MAG: DUF4920 domain-containing protein [Rhodothermales bacterium]